MSHSADILIVTVNRNEAKAVLDTFATATSAEASIFNEGNHSYHDLGSLNGQHVVMVQSEMGSVGLGASLQTVQESVAALRPAAVIMVGVAFGLKQAKQVIGQVLVADRIMSYEPQRVGKKGGKEDLIPRGVRADVSTKLLNHLRAAEVKRETAEPRVSFGTIISGEKLVDNPEFREKLRLLEPEAIGGEMEGAGLYAACQLARVDWILVKGICDWADGNKDNPNKDRDQQLAAGNAASFVVEALQKGRLVPPRTATGSTARRLSGNNQKPAKIVVTLSDQLANFTEKKKQALITTLASLAGIEEDELHILQVMEGSVKVIIEMPEAAAQTAFLRWQELESVRYMVTPPFVAQLKRLNVARIEMCDDDPRYQETTGCKSAAHRLGEQQFEDAVVAALTASPFYRQRPTDVFDAARSLDIAEAVEFVKATQPKEWAKLSKQFPGKEEETLASQLAALIQKRGTLDVLRNGIAFNGINLQLAYFRPSGGGNPEHQARYEANRFAVMRQVHFSKKTPDQSVDLVVLLNGLPLLSVELKNHFTGQWSVAQGIAQYRKRDPREPFWNRCLVHFAVDDDSAYFTTRVNGNDTEFFPFNRDTKNPVIPGRFSSSYLWDDFTDEDGQAQPGLLRADSLLLLIQNYLHFERDEKTGKEKFIFPRYQQLMCVRKLLAHSREHGSGHNYLVQHSAGSGKSNSIAWFAHQLANLCGADNQLVFDSVVVVTDRRILDRQLQNTIKQFEKIKGVVSKIDRNTRQLVKALERGDKIIITTLQKFGFVGEMAKLPGKRFAVIVDEAHSSQTGENVKDLKLALTSDEQLKEALERDNEGESEDPLEAELERIQKARQKLPHLSFFAFTATPKEKTLELFGTPIAGAPVDAEIRKRFKPFHEYTMRQAIEEGFILDVLQSYTTYKTYFELVENEKADSDKLVEELKARRLLLEHVDRHEFAIRRKAHIIVDHFTRKTAHKINGQAKAMVVTHSRAHAVLFHQALEEVLREQNLNFGLLVAFSGTVTLKEKKYTEESMNPPGTGDLAEAFKQPEMRILVAANKFQTGFDQPLLHTMYVDKKLGGVAAVQTLSRLNRTIPGNPSPKQDTFVLDFVNTQEVIKASFQDYYQKTELEGATDPNKLYNLRYTLEQMHVFTAEDVAQFLDLFVIKKVSSEKLQPFFQRIVKTGYDNLGSEHLGTPDYEKQKAEAKDKFRKEVARYIRQYAFISQIMTFLDHQLEGVYHFAKLLLKQLPYEPQKLPLEIVEMIDMDKYRVQEEQSGSILLAPEDASLEPSADDGHRGKADEPEEKLQVIVRQLNEDYGIAFEEADRVVNAIKQKLQDDDGLRAAFQTSSIEFLRRQKLQESIKEAFLSNADEFLNFMSKTETDPGFGKFFFSEMFKWYQDSVAAGMSEKLTQKGGKR